MLKFMQKKHKKWLMLMALLLPLALQAQTYQSVPYVEGFENPTGTPPLPTGWVNYATSTSSAGTFPSAYEYSPNCRTGSYYYELESSNGATEIGATPEFENVSGLMMDFYYCINSSYAPTMLEVGVMEDTTFVPVDTVNFTTVYSWNTYYPYRVYFTDYTGDGTRIAFRATKNNSSQYTVFIDDLTISNLPTCPFMPSDPVATVDSLGVTLTWTEPTTSAGYFIYLNNDSTWYNTNSNSYTFTGLNPATNYSGFIYNSCDGTDTSEAVAFSFFTNCANVVIAPDSPFIEDFENGISPCYLQEYVSGSHDWYATSTSSNPNGAHSGSQVAAYTHSSTGSETMLILPAFDMSALANGAELGFWHTQVSWGGDQDELYVYYRTSDTGAWIQIAGYTDNISSWTEEIITLPNSSYADFYQIAFKGYDSYGYGVKLDDISVFAASSCPAPIAFYSTGSASGEVYLEWRDSVSYAWEVAFGPMGITPDTVVVNLISGLTDTTTTLMGLEDSITYDFYLRADCSSEQSRWLGPVTVRPNVIAMTANATDTVYACGTTLTDDGGIIGNYAYSQTSYMVVYPTDSTQTVSLNGSYDLYTSYGSNYATLTIYEGVGTTGRVLGQYTGSGSLSVASTTGPATIKFYSFGYGESYSASGFALQTSCSDLSSCPDPYDISVSNVAGASAVLNWDYGTVGTPDYWNIEVIDTVSGSTLTFSAPDTARSYTLTGLDQATYYEVRLQASCTTGDTSNFIATSFTTGCLAGGDIQVGTGTTQLTSHPINTYYSYSYCQMLFTPSDLARLADTIYGLKLLANSASSGNFSINIYIDTTSRTSFSSYADAVNMDSSKLVYSGVVSLSAGENEFLFDTAWVRPDLNANVVVTIDNNTGNYYSSSYWLGTPGLNGSTLWQYSDGTNVNPSSAASESSISTTDNRPNVVFITPCAEVTCVAPNVTYTTTSNSVTLNWVAGSSESSWSVEYKLATDTTWTVQEAITASTTAYISGLNPNTLYDFRVTSLCDDTSAAALLQVRTSCGAITDAMLPLTESFEGFLAESSRDEMQTCWFRGPGYDWGTYFSYYPYTDNYMSHTGGSCLDFDGYNIDATLVLPEFGIAADSLFMSFYTYTSSYSSPTLYVGVMTDPAVDSTFVPVDTIDLGTSETWNLHEIGFRNYNGNGHYLAIRCSYDHLYLDDLTVLRNVDCDRVDSISVVAVTDTSATISFVDTNNVGSYTIYWGTTDDLSAATDSATFTTIPATITGLTSSTWYYAWIRTNCTYQHSFWAPVGTFRSFCPFEVVTPTAPYTEGFENGFSTCTMQQYISGTHDWMATSTASNPSSAHGGTQVAAYTHVNSGSETMLILPTFDFTSLDHGALLTFWHTQAVWVSDQDELYVYYRTSDTASWTLLESYLDNITDWTEEAIPLPNSTNADFYQIGFSAYDSYGYGVKLDDITVSTDFTCSRPDSLAAVCTDVTATLSWTGTAASYIVEYQLLDSTTVTTLTATSNTLALGSLNPASTYAFRVRAICNADDSSRWSSWFTFTTDLCPNSDVYYSYDSTMAPTTSSYAPIGYSYYNYAYVQTIVDSATLAGLNGDISAMAFKPATTNAGTYYTNMDVYLANVSDSDLSAGFILPDSTHQFVQVTNGADFTYTTTDWQLFSLDTTFTWDGHSNILVSVNRRHGSYTSGSSFSAHSTSDVKTRYAYSDGSAYDINTVSGGYSGYYVGDLQFIVCQDGCPAPVITNVTYDYETATISWVGTGSTYQVNIKESATIDWPTPVIVTGNTYTFTGLNAATSYTFRVRQDCTADSADYSVWVVDGFTTDSLPCLTPSALSVSDLSNAQGTFSWTSNGNETQWDLHVWNLGGLDSVYRLTTNPATVDGFTAGVTYNAAIRSICGSAQVEGDYSDTIIFTTLTCPDVTGLSVGEVTAFSITLNWDASTAAQSWIIEYGYAGFSQGAGTTVYSNYNTYVISGLEDESTYDFYVKAVCGDNWNSESWTRVSATTLSAPDENFTVTATPADPSMGTVTGSGTYALGQTCTLTATPNAGFQFESWSNGETSNPYSFVVTADVTLQAIFTPLEGIDPVASDATCTLFPNPASGSTTVSISGVSGAVRISVVDINGRTVSTETLQCGDDCQKTLQLEGLTQGTYFVKVTGESLNIVKKLIVR